MLPLLGGLTMFMLFAGAGALATAMRLISAEGRAGFASARLYRIAVALCFSFPAAALIGVSVAWALHGEGVAAAPLAALAPLGWLVGMGALFAIVDVAEDGVLDFGRGTRRRG